MNSFNILMSFTYCNPHVHDYRSNGQLRNIFLQISAWTPAINSILGEVGVSSDCIFFPTLVLQRVTNT